MPLKTFLCRPCDYVWEKDTEVKRTKCPKCRKRRKERIRMFVCGPCQRKFWARGTEAKCFDCNELLEALPHEKEYGIGHYTCVCGNDFYSRAQYGDTSPCYRCHEVCDKMWIIPNKFSMKKETSNTHSCERCEHEHMRSNCPNFAKIINVSQSLGALHSSRK